MEISNVTVNGIEESLKASGYPMATNINDCTVDFNRGNKLGKKPLGSGHSTFLCGITVQANLTCSQAMHMQFLRYHFIDIISSQSKMHRLIEMKVSESSNEYVDLITINHLKGLIKLYKAEQTKENYLKVIYNCPMGLELTFRFTTNYLQLKTIYHQRKKHRLPEWREFCNWILTLPHFKELVFEKEVAPLYPNSEYREKMNVK